MRIFVACALLAVSTLAEPPVDNRYLPPQQDFNGGFSPPSQSYGAPQRQTDAVFGPQGHFYKSESTSFHKRRPLLRRKPKETQQGRPSSTYGAPSNGRSSSRRPSNQYGPPQPSSQYGTPQFRPQQPSNQYGPPQSRNQPSNQYGPPQNRAQQPSNQYGPPQARNQPSNQYIPPQQPSNQYGPPQARNQPSNQYGPPMPQFGRQSQFGGQSRQPSNQYGPPNQVSNQYLPPNQAQGRQPSEYNAPQARQPSSQYGSPGQAQGRQPSSQYGAPGQAQTRQPSTQYSAPSQAQGRQPSSQYGAPEAQARQPSSQYGAPEFGTPSQEYGAPSAGQQYSQGGNYENAQSRQYLPPGAGRNGDDDGSNGEPANYSFEYMVKDDASGNDFGHRESRMGDRAEGLYYVLLPDGRKQTVEYEADQDGYKPRISYEDTGAGAGYDANSQNYAQDGGYNQNGGY